MGAETRRALSARGSRGWIGDVEDKEQVLKEVFREEQSRGCRVISRDWVVGEVLGRRKGERE